MIKNISINLLIPFENHPFKKRNGIEQQELTESIKENGLLEPCKELEITSIPVTIKELTKDEAIVQMVDSNIHREHILPSEKAFALSVLKFTTMRKSILTTMLKWIFTLQLSDYLTFRQNSNLLTQWKE